mgnify:CR=1 FL=1
MQQNPYTLLFGKEPVQMISRKADSAVILSSFLAEQPSQQVYMITGVRGTGKTVFMTEIMRQLSRQEQWVVVELNPERNLLEDLAAKLNSDRLLAGIFQKADIDLSFFGIGVKIEGSHPAVNLETALSHMLESLKKNGKRVLIAIDEVTSTPGMRVFVHSFQMFVRQDLPVFLIMTGLYQNIDLLQNEKGLTFLYRAPKITLFPLSIRAISRQYQETFELDQKSADTMAAITKGYSFAFQVLGYLAWEHGGDYLEVIDEYKRYLADYSYDKIWIELSPGDRKIAHGIAASGSGKILDIRNYMKIETNQFNPYRKRLIKKGVLNGDVYGYVNFVLPYFKEYILENYSELEVIDDLL